MISPLTIFWSVWILLSPPEIAPLLSAEPAAERARIEKIVHDLASAEMAGRRGKSARLAERYLVDTFAALGLEPAFGELMTQEIPAREPGLIYGRNVGGILRGDDPQLRDEWVLVAAHFDHLGVRDGQVYPGADDNASGLAWMLEMARCLAERHERPRRSVMFLAFDVEEIGLFGSRYFANHCPIPHESIRLVFVSDMVGRSLGGLGGDEVFVLGSEHAPDLRPWLRSANSQVTGVELALLGTDIVGTRSDYGPFRDRKIPYLFFSTGESDVYHTHLDRAETLNYPKLTAITDATLTVLERAVDSQAIPSWVDRSPPSQDELLAIGQVIDLIQANLDRIGLAPWQQGLLANTRSQIQKAIEEDSYTPARRVALVQVCRLLLIALRNLREDEQGHEEIHLDAG